MNNHRPMKPTDYDTYARIQLSERDNDRQDSYRPDDSPPGIYGDWEPVPLMPYFIVFLVGAICGAGAVLALVLLHR